MAKYRKVDPRIWNDEKFCGLSDDGKLVFLFLLTHPFMTSLGAMRGNTWGLSCELGWEHERLSKAFLEAFAKGMVEYEEKASCIALPKFIKYNQPENPNVLKAWVSSADLIPECDLKAVVLQRVKAFTKGLSESFQEALPKSFGTPLPKQEQEQEQEQEPNKEEDFLIVFNHWVSKTNLTKHREVTSKIKSSIKARLKAYSVDELKTAIDRYSASKSDDSMNCPGFGKWGLAELMGRGGGEWVEKFLTDGWDESLRNWKKSLEPKGSTGETKEERKARHDGYRAENEKRRIEYEERHARSAAVPQEDIDRAMAYRDYLLEVWGDNKLSLEEWKEAGCPTGGVGE